MNVVKKHLSLINKNEFQKSMIKITWGDDMQIARQKHFQMIVNTLLGQNEKISQEEGGQIIVEYILQIETKKWMKSLKTLMLVHYILNTIPKKLQPIISQYIQNPATLGVNNLNGQGLSESTNQCVNKSNSTNNKSSSQNRSGSLPKCNNKIIVGNNKLVVSTNNSQQQIEIVHQILVSKYHDYVIILNEKLDCINYLAGKEISKCHQFSKEWPKIKTLLVLFIHVQQFMRELEVSLTNFKKLEVIHRITCLLSNNLMQVYQIFKPIITNILQQFKEFENPNDFIKFFTFYSDFITITKNMSKFNLFKLQVAQQFVNDFTSLELYIIDKDINKQIELYHLTVKQTKKMPNQRTQFDFLSMGVSTHAEDSPTKLFNKDGFTRNDIFQRVSNKQCDIEDTDSIFKASTFTHGKPERPQSANVIQNKQSQGERSVKANDKNQKLLSEIEQNNLILKELSEGHKDSARKNQKEMASTFKIIKVDQEDNGINEKIKQEQKKQHNEETEVQLDNMKFTNTQIARKPSTPSQSNQQYNSINSHFKIQSKQFYDMKNNPLSFLKSSSLTKDSTTSAQQYDDKEGLSGSKIVVQKCHSLNENGDINQIRNNGEYDNSQELTNSKNITSEYSPPQNFSKFSNNARFIENKEDLSQDEYLKEQQKNSKNIQLNQC